MVLERFGLGHSKDALTQRLTDSHSRLLCRLRSSFQVPTSPAIPAISTTTGPLLPFSRACSSSSCCCCTDVGEGGDVVLVFSEDEERRRHQAEDSEPNVEHRRRDLEEGVEAGG